MKHIMKDGKAIPMTGAEFKAYEDSKIPEKTYVELRKEEYPDIGDQLDAIMKQFNYMRLSGYDLISEADEWVNECLNIKNKYKKPDSEEDNASEES